MKEKRLVFVSSHGDELPFYLETIGINPKQEKIVRPSGYPFFHWIQTISGSGRFSINGKSISLRKNSGILLRPNTPHSYQSELDSWGTTYFTFRGPLVEELCHQLNLSDYTYYEWEEENPISYHLIKVFEQLRDTEDVFGIQASTEVYKFLILLNKYGKLQKNTDISTNLEKLQPLVRWMEKNIGNPNIGLNELAVQFHVSPRQLNTVFHKTFEISPYAFFLHLRIKYAKEILLNDRKITVKEISEKVGFRSPSHFIKTFKKLVGFSPEQFRLLH